MVPAFLLLLAIDPAIVDRIGRDALVRHEVPGVAIGVFEKGRIYTAGYGVRSIVTRQPVTAKTIFATGSVTKSFTALGAALLVEEGKLDWDKPVREYLPWFRLYDEQATQEITIRDMLTHRSGLPRYDFLRFAVPLSREEIVRRLRYLPPTAPLREKYQYNNLIYVAAGYLTGQRAEMSWEELVEKRIFAPLKMNDSTVRVADTLTHPDYAMPHENGRQVEFYDYQKFGVGPNGAVNSTVGDLLKYLRYHMDKAPAELHRPQQKIDDYKSYALGWDVLKLAGHTEISHSGSITGFRAWVGFYPDDQVAIVVLMNGPGAPTLTGQRIAREIFGSREVEYPMTSYLGTYEHPAFGPCTVTAVGDDLRVAFPAWQMLFKRGPDDVFRGPDAREIRFAGSAPLQEAPVPAEMLFRVEAGTPLLTFKRVR